MNRVLKYHIVKIVILIFTLSVFLNINNIKNVKAANIKVACFNIGKGTGEYLEYNLDMTAYKAKKIIGIYIIKSNGTRVPITSNPYTTSNGYVTSITGKLTKDFFNNEKKYFILPNNLNGEDGRRGYFDIPDRIEKVAYNDDLQFPGLSQYPSYRHNIEYHYPRNENWLTWSKDPATGKWRWMTNNDFDSDYKKGIQKEGSVLTGKIQSGQTGLGNEINVNDYIIKTTDLSPINNPNYIYNYITGKYRYPTQNSTYNDPSSWTNHPLFETGAESNPNKLVGPFLAYYNYGFTVHLQGEGTKMIDNLIEVDYEGDTDSLIINAHTDPEQSETGGIKPVKVTVKGQYYGEASQVASLKLKCKTREDASYNHEYELPGQNLSIEKVFDFNIDTKGKEYTQYFDAQFLVTLRDGTTKHVEGITQTIFSKTYTPPNTNRPPECHIIAPSTVTWGDDVYIRGSATDPDGDTLGYEWNIYPGTYINVPVEEEQEDRLKVRFNEIKTYTVELYVTDFKGGSDTNTKNIKVLPPIPVVYIDSTGCLKENRKVTLSAEKSWPGSMSCSMDWSKSEWAITPITEGITSDSIKTASSYNGVSNLDVLFKKAGKYKVKCTLYNNLGYSDYKEVEINIAPDIPPIANFTLTNEVYRNPDDENYATINVNDSSISNDNDIIEKKVWTYCFDSNNDNDFSNETIYVFNNGEWVSTGLKYSEIGKLDINNTNDGNKIQVQIKTKHVGKYRVELIVREQFGQATIEQFITVDDKKKGNTFE